ncbi:glycoside hydrolase family 68 protein, partial [Vibrio cholerae]|nr:glycoside hydrolase family 68 protein [Vibrio cholerae]
MKSTPSKFGKTPHQPSLWTRADALKVHADDPTTTQPLVSANFPVLSDEVFIWDTMPLRD